MRSMRHLMAEGRALQVNGHLIREIRDHLPVSLNVDLKNCKKGKWIMPTRRTATDNWDILVNESDKVAIDMPDKIDDEYNKLKDERRICMNSGGNLGRNSNSRTRLR